MKNRFHWCQRQHLCFEGILGLSSHFATKDKDKVLTIIKEVLLNPVLTLPNLKREKQVIG
jgi:predicted Zn-dependent peptidase